MKKPNMKTLHLALTGLAFFALTACSPMVTQNDTYRQIHEDVQNPKAQPKTPAAVDAALLPPLPGALPPTARAKRPAEPRFDISVVDAPAAQVFMALVDGTRYNLLLPPDISGNITLHLKNVTVRDSLEIIRELYDYDFTIRGNRIAIASNTLQTRMFKVDYLASRRYGGTQTRVLSNVPPPSDSTSTTSQTDTNTDSTNVFTGVVSDFWSDLSRAVAVSLGCDFESKHDGTGMAFALSREDKSKCPEGRYLSINRQSGVVIAKAFPAELREIGKIIDTLQGGATRQVMLEAKLIEVSLADGFEAGINWSRLQGGDHSNGWSWAGNTASAGFLTSGSSSLPTLVGSGASFASTIKFLQTQGTVHVLSSPRITTLNNQKAVLKVGEDQYFITGVDSGDVSSNNASLTGSSISLPDVTLNPFFSGITLDVTPQIDEVGNITLHVHPSISQVTERSLNVNFGDIGGGINYQLPTASVQTKETDSIVRVQDGMIVAIGGLMSQESRAGEDKLPILGDIPILGNLVKNTNRGTRKSELVVLIKPTIIRTPDDWRRDMEALSERLEDYDPANLPNVGGPVSNLVPDESRSLPAPPAQ
ncbi:MAG: pilus (MSHA type) biogenesis protein MshL [Zoogloeaceae bacterium]|jgi:MSHA biogenesis protein MshL|nr:pilus (MSHA type) biogenesis protein MshL [Zoogloeaceae bacterium]